MTTDSWDEYIAKNGFPSREQAMAFIQEEHSFANNAARYLLDRAPSVKELEKIVVASETLGDDAWIRLRQVANKSILTRVIRKLGILCDDPSAIVLDSWYLFLAQNPSLDEMMQILEDAECLEAMVLHEMMRRQADWSTVDNAVLPNWFRSFIQRRRVWEKAIAAKTVIRDISAT